MVFMINEYLTSQTCPECHGQITKETAIKHARRPRRTFKACPECKVWGDDGAVVKDKDGNDIKRIYDKDISACVCIATIGLSRLLRGERPARFCR